MSCRGYSSKERP